MNLLFYKLYIKVAKVGQVENWFSNISVKQLLKLILDKSVSLGKPVEIIKANCFCLLQALIKVLKLISNHTVAYSDFLFFQALKWFGYIRTQF